MPRNSKNKRHLTITCDEETRETLEASLQTRIEILQNMRVACMMLATANEHQICDDAFLKPYDIPQDESEFLMSCIDRESAYQYFNTFSDDIKRLELELKLEQENNLSPFWFSTSDKSPNGYPISTLMIRNSSMYNRQNAVNSEIQKNAIQPVFI